MLVTSIAFKYQVFAYDEERTYASKISIPICTKKEARKHLKPIFEQIKIYFQEEHNIEVLTKDVKDLKHITYYTREELNISEKRRYAIAGEFFDRTRLE